MTIAEALRWGTAQLKKDGVDSPVLDAEVLLTKAIPSPRVGEERVRGRAWLYAHPEEVLTSAQLKMYKQYITRRVKREPVAYILGRKEFYGLDFLVNRQVLIPRPESELLVEEALKEARRCQVLGIRCQVVDVGTGSGAIIIAIAKTYNLKSITYFATDISTEALRVARENARRHGVEKQITFLWGNLLEPIFNYATRYTLHATRLIITANLPYLPTAEWRATMPDVRRFEPRQALDGGKDGLKYYGELFKQLHTCVIPVKTGIQNPGSPRLASTLRESRRAIRSGMTVVVEICPHQAKEIKILARKFFPRASVKIIKDLSGRARVAKISL